MLVIISACGGDSASDTTDGATTSSTAPIPNVVSADAWGQDVRIACLLSEDAGPEEIEIGLLDAALPPWWATLEVETPTQSGDTLEALLAEAVFSPETAIKKAALADAGGNSIPSTLGQVLVEAEEYAAGACVLASGSATAALGPDADGAGFSMTYLAYKAGQAYELAGLTDAALDWYGVAAPNPGNDPAGQFYADQAAEHLP